MTVVVHVTEFLLGDIYLDPTGTGLRTDDGKSQWAVDLHHAVVDQAIAWRRKGALPELQLGPWADNLAIRRGVAMAPEQVERLQRVFPDRRIRPFVVYGVASLVAGSPRNVTPVTLDVELPPESWRDADWRDVGSSEQLDLDGTDRTVPGALVPRTIRDLAAAWRSHVDPSMVPVEPTDGVLVVGVCEPVWVHSDEEHFEPVGRDGDQLWYLVTDPLSDPTDGVTVYRPVDIWPEIQTIVHSLGTAELQQRTGLSETVARNVVAGRHVSERTKQIVAAALQYIGDVHHRTCPRIECGNRLRPRQRYCTTACREIVESAEYQLALHEQGAAQCRYCKVIRWGELSGLCPHCGKPKRHAA